MKRFNQIMCAVIIGVLVSYGGLWWSLSQIQGDSARSHRLEIERLVQELKNTSLEQIDWTSYPSIKKLTPLLNQEEATFFEGENDDYVIRRIHEQYVRIDYELQPARLQAQPAALFLALTLTLLLLALLYWYIRTQIILPYTSIAQLPYELAKGNLQHPLAAKRDQTLHEFLWGLDVLREELEQSKQKQLQLQKEKKLLILALSHDMKTPLSSIKLYAAALRKHLYDNPQRLQEIAGNIEQKTTQIEALISEIAAASKEDFLELKVEVGEFYYADLIDELKQYYQEKLQLLKIPFHVVYESNCLLKGDFLRSIEVMQNVMENAIKYGDGGEITLTSHEEEDCRLIQVTNGGCTLLPQEAPYLFDSFFRGTNATEVTGSGLGLYIAKTIMEKMDGGIYATIKEQRITITVVFCKG